MDKQLQGIIRPPWIELWKLQSPHDWDVAAARLFGNQPSKPGETPKPYKAGEYRTRFGLDTAQYTGFYAEAGPVEAPVGPVTPATARLKIRPILAIRMSRSGNYYGQGLELATGFFNREKTRAWVKVDDYENLLGDTFFQELMEEAERIKNAEADHESSQGRKVTIMPVQQHDNLSARERAILEEVLKRGT